MSRIGKLPITIPETVDVNYNETEIVIKGKFGTLTQEIPDVININSRKSNLNSWIKKRNKKSSCTSRFISNINQ